VGDEADGRKGGSRKERERERRYDTRVYERLVAVVWVYTPCRRDKIFQMASGEILRSINWDNGASDLRRLAKKSVLCLSSALPPTSAAPMTLRGDISHLENVTESAAMHIQRNRILMKGADCSWNAKCTLPRGKLAVNWEERRDETRSTQVLQFLTYLAMIARLLSIIFLPRNILLLRN